MALKRTWILMILTGTKIPWRRAWQSTPVFLPGDPMGRGVWWTVVHRVAKSQTQLKQLSMHTEVPLWFRNIFVFLYSLPIDCPHRTLTLLSSTYQFAVMYLCIIICLITAYVLTLDTKLHEGREHQLFQSLNIQWSASSWQLCFRRTFLSLKIF